MLIISLIAVVSTLCWLVFTFAVYAVPAFVGLSAAMFAHQTGAGALGSSVVGLAAAVATLLAFQHLFAATTNAVARQALALGFAGPAAYSGFHAAIGVAGMSADSAAWVQVLGLIGGAIVGAVAWTRLTALAPPAAPGGASQSLTADF